MRQVLSDDQSGSPDGPDMTLDGYGFRWLRLPGETAVR